MELYLGSYLVFPSHGMPRSNRNDSVGNTCLVCEGGFMLQNTSLGRDEEQCD